MNLKAVVFDLDGVITSTSTEHFLAWGQLAGRLGATPLSAHVFDDIKGISRLESLDIVLADIGMQTRFTESEKSELGELKNRIYVDMIREFDETNLADGAIELFELLRKSNVRIALGSVSSSGRMLLERMKIIDYFDHIVDPHKVKNAKPAPDIFLSAAQYLEVDCRYCAGIEDAAAGITAIKSSGMFAVGIGEERLLSHADIIYERLKDVDIWLINERLLPVG